MQVIFFINVDIVNRMLNIPVLLELTCLRSFNLQSHNRISQIFVYIFYCRHISRLKFSHDKNCKRISRLNFSHEKNCRHISRLIFLHEKKTYNFFLY